MIGEELQVGGQGNFPVLWALLLCTLERGCFFFRVRSRWTNLLGASLALRHPWLIQRPRGFGGPGESGYGGVSYMAALLKSYHLLRATSTGHSVMVVIMT